MRWHKAIPALDWLGRYQRQHLVNDSLAAVIVTVMLIPQSLAYALLSGLPAEMGLYASILPLIAYALFGTSRTLSVGPVAVASLMTASAVGSVVAVGTADYATAAAMLALMGGVMLIALGFLRFGFVANFLSHSVVSGFITASGLIIALAQVGPLLGVPLSGDTLPHLLSSLVEKASGFHGLTAAIGLGAMVFLIFARNLLGSLLQSTGVSTRNASLITRAAPLLVMLVVMPLSATRDFESLGVPLVGHVPSGLPAFSMPFASWDLVRELTLPALLIALIGFIESVAVGKTLGAKRQQKIDASQELIGLGAANVASAVSGGFPVTGGFSRSVVNFDAGADTQMASLLTAFGIGIAALVLTPALYYLPKAVLAATIVVAVLSLVDWRTIILARRFSSADFCSILVTIGTTLTLGVELGVLAGVGVSIGMHLYQTTRPHVAVVGQVAGSEHYRNVDRHEVETHPQLLSIRIDESLYFANIQYLEEFILYEASLSKEIRHVVVIFAAVNGLDLSALEGLESINNRLFDRGIRMHLSEVKGPVMDALQKTDFLQQLSGEVFLTHHGAVHQLTVA